jgi:hypothetical protein
MGYEGESEGYERNGYPLLEVAVLKKIRISNYECAGNGFLHNQTFTKMHPFLFATNKCLYVISRSLALSKSQSENKFYASRCNGLDKTVK